jgi:ubiquinone/menaquinone biosynthesis C-methylase UbiE
MLYHDRKVIPERKASQQSMHWEFCADFEPLPIPCYRSTSQTARLVLVNVPKPELIVKEMIRLVRPGGTIALHEPDAVTQRYDPPLYILPVMDVECCC